MRNAERQRNRQEHMKLKKCKTQTILWNVSVYHILFGTFVSVLVWLLIKDVNKRMKFTNLKSSTSVPLFRTVCKQAGYDVDDLYDMYDLSVITNSTEDQMYTEGFSRHYFNQFVSDKLDPNRPIPDVRHKLCKNRNYPAHLPTVTVIICFLNEAFSALLRTIHSVINRTPTELLREIVLIDDFSSLEDLKEHLKEHLQLEYYKKVILLRNQHRKGLIMSRIIGSRRATGEVLVFLDSHCEVNTGWIEPLLDRIVLDIKTVVAPIVDSVDAYTMVYDSVPVLVGGFKWNLFFRWDPISVRIKKKLPDLSHPIESPTISGGLFAIDKEYFRELGEYDPKLKIWGGENMEISFKVWQCGGKIEIVPCSRVGHIYRKVQPNVEKNDNNIKRNLLRVAHTWMDEYQKYVYDARPNLQGVDYGDVTERLILRNRLRCQSFTWYLKNIFPEQNIPDDQAFELKEEKRENLLRNTYLMHFKHENSRRGKILHVKSGLCLGYDYDQEYRNMVVLIYCNSKYVMTLLESNQHDIRPGGNDYCLHINTAESYLELELCTYTVQQKFIWRKQNTIIQLLNPGTGKCLYPDSNEEDSSLLVGYCTLDMNLNFAMIK